MTPQTALWKKSSRKQGNETVVFCNIVTDLLGFPRQLSVSLYLLPVLRSRSWPNVELTGCATIGIVRPWSADVSFINVIFFDVGDWKWQRRSVDDSICLLSKLTHITESINSATFRVYSGNQLFKVLSTGTNACPQPWPPLINFLVRLNWPNHALSQGKNTWAEVSLFSKNEREGQIQKR